MSEENPRQALDKDVDAIESAYEYCLAYAAQGRSTDRDTAQLRMHLGQMLEALNRLGRDVRECVSARGKGLAEAAAAFLEAIDDDAKKAAGALQLVLAQPDISSQLVDNFNASIHVRALLTDLFIVDESMKERAH